MSNEVLDEVLVNIFREKYSEKETLGSLVASRGVHIIFKCKTLELADKDNAKKVSCIPKGEYWVEKRNSPKYGDHFHILDVLDRDMILIHNANFFSQLLGCIAVGRTHADINADGEGDVTSSKETLQDMNEKLPKRFKLIIA